MGRKMYWFVPSSGFVVLHPCMRGCHGDGAHDCTNSMIRCDPILIGCGSRYLDCSEPEGGLVVLMLVLFVAYVIFIHASSQSSAGLVVVLM
jgi:hypothetical protein